MNTILVDPRVSEFVSLVNEGIEAWVQAGRLLCDMAQDNPEIYTTILSDNPHLTRDILQSFERVGKKEIYPYLLVDGSPGARMLSAMPYDSQVKLYNGRVRVVVKRGGSLEPVDKRVCDLTQPEAVRVFDGDQLRSVAEQMKLMRPAHISARGCRAVPVVENPSPSVEENESRLDENPKAELARLMTRANDTLLEARTALSMVQRESKWDLCISTALTAIGKLRFALNSGELDE